jgi:argininosuccinate lyase
MAMDMCLYNSQNFGFVSFPDAFTTGSSIMPHKKNPDVWELVRGKCNAIKSLPNNIMLLTSNLPSGYHRDLQLLKEHLFPALSEIKACIELSRLMLENIKVNNHIIDDEKYNYIFSVEDVNRLVENGMPFREAYKQVASVIAKGQYSPEKTVNHEHEGSIGNLCNKKIQEKFEHILSEFDFNTFQEALAKLLR